MTYRFAYRLGPKEPEIRSISVDAPSQLVAFDRVDTQLRLKYPHYQIEKIEEFPIFDSDPEELYRTTEKRGAP
jgi:hypothetical protein